MTGERSTETHSRRSVLKTAAGVGAGLATAEAATNPAAAGKGGDCDPDGEPPRIDTSDHFDTTWYGSVYLTDGNTTTNYDRVGGDLPGDPDELVVHLHGWRNGEDCGIDGIESTGGAYGDVGYGHPVTGLTWDSAYAWWNAKEIAARNAPKLAAFLTDFKNDNPGTKIRLQAHSLGARVLAETVLALEADEETDVVTTAVFMAGAIDDESVAVDGKYGEALAAATGHVENFWKPDDSVLNWAYGAFEGSQAIGNDGCDGASPENYTDHEVTKDIGHSDYYDDRDIIGQVVESYE